ncbi:hypothetical protein KHP57_16665, partial [Algiphilus sp. NNCM1]|nr:hypothetical protein [Algiphilus acroporae]
GKGAKKETENRMKKATKLKKRESAEPRKRLSAQRPLAAAKNGARGYAWPGASSYSTDAADRTLRRVAN